MMSQAMMRIKKELKEQEITQTDFAKMIGVTDVTVHRWLTGQRSPSIDHVEQMARVLGMHVLVYR